jgi:hypothetical protein
MVAQSWTAPAVTLELDRDLINRFRPAAAKRSTTVPHLLQDILEVMAEEPALIGAVLDDQTDDR